MSPLRRGIVIAVVQAALVLAVGGSFLYQRATLPRAWVLTAGFDPQLPIRGRYVDLRLVIDVRGSPDELAAAIKAQHGWVTARAGPDGLQGELLPDAARPGTGLNVTYETARQRWFLSQPIAFFLSEHEPDPTRLEEGEELWAEVTVPPHGAPRPIRLDRRRAPPAPSAEDGLTPVEPAGEPGEQRPEQ
ncbi:MAG TPA: hypothetical protein VIW02_06605 [Gammaproteobacteria bacterium]